MGAFVIGHNLAGYLPEGDTHSFATFPEALAAFGNMVREYADNDDEANDSMSEADWADEDYGSMRAEVDAVLADPSRFHVAADERSAGMILMDNDNRSVSFWLQWEPTREPDTTE